MYARSVHLFSQQLKYKLTLVQFTVNINVIDYLSNYLDCQASSTADGGSVLKSLLI